MTDKQIIERLKKDLDFERTKRKSLQADLKAKEQECEELKHKVELMMDCASCKVDEYKQTLTEIKEIAESYTTCKMDWYFGFKNILQKISEVENEYN